MKLNGEKSNVRREGNVTVKMTGPAVRKKDTSHYCASRDRLPENVFGNLWL